MAQYPGADLEKSLQIVTSERLFFLTVDYVSINRPSFYDSRSTGDARPPSVRHRYPAGHFLLVQL